MPAGTWNLGRIRRTVDYINLAAAPSIEFFDQTAESLATKMLGQKLEELKLSQFQKKHRK